jgi:GxxExxY protein
MTAQRKGVLLEETLTRAVIGAFFDVFKELGFGFREYIYSLALQRELLARGHRVDREVAVTVFYRAQPLAWQLIDMIIDEKIVVEIKAGERLAPNAERQLFGYLCASNLEVGLLLHFAHKPQFQRVICENRLKRR